MLLTDSAAQKVAQIILFVLAAGVALALGVVIVWFLLRGVVELLGAMLNAFEENWPWFLGAGALAALIALAVGLSPIASALIGVGVSTVWTLLAAFN